MRIIDLNHKSGNVTISLSDKEIRSVLNGLDYFLNEYLGEPTKSEVESIEITRRNFSILSDIVDNGFISQHTIDKYASKNEGNTNAVNKE